MTDSLRVLSLLILALGAVPVLAADRARQVPDAPALEANADDDDWKQSGFLAGWVAHKVLLGEEEKCPEKNKKTVSFAEALRKFLDKSGYR